MTASLYQRGSLLSVVCISECLGQLPTSTFQLPTAATRTKRRTLRRLVVGNWALGAVTRSNLQRQRRIVLRRHRRQVHLQDVADACLRIEPHVIAFAAPVIALVREQVE